MTKKRGGALLALALISGAAVVMTAAATSSAKSSAVPSWCGPKKIKLGFTDGFGGNSWRLVTTASARAEAKKCPSVTDARLRRRPGQHAEGDLRHPGHGREGRQRARRLPGRRQGDPARADAAPTRPASSRFRTASRRAARPASTTTSSSTRRSPQAGENWGRVDPARCCRRAATCSCSAARRATARASRRTRACTRSSIPRASTSSSARSRSRSTNWDPALTQKVLSAAIAKYPKIDVIVSDFGPSLVGALPEFKKSGRTIPALATSDGNVLGCFWKKNQAANPTFKLFTVSTQNDHARLAIDWAIALATGGKKPASTHFPSLVFEDSTTGKPQPGGVQGQACRVTSTSPPSCRRPRRPSW